MSHTLIVYASLPEEVNSYLVPNGAITPAMRQLLAQSHGKLVNSDTMNDGMEFLNAALATDPDHVIDNPDCGIDLPEYACIFAEYKQEQDTPPFENVIITHVYSSGFIL